MKAKVNMMLYDIQIARGEDTRRTKIPAQMIGEFVKKIIKQGYVIDFCMIAW